MANRRSFLAEMKRRNVLRAAVLYAGAVWALSQGVSQLTPALGLPDYATRWLLIACVIGFPFWIAFAWFYEFTPHGFKRESEAAEDIPARHSNARKLDFAIIGVLIVAVALLASGYFVHRNAPATAAQAIPAKSIAVLPFENLSDDKNNEYFVAGMQDLILTKLADVGGLKVISRTSTAKYQSHPDDLKTIGQQLGVATILEGSVQKSGNEVLINVQLIDARSDSHIWAESYTRTLTNIFGVEGEVAQKIASALNAKLSPAQTASLAAVPTTNQAAYDLFLRADYQTNLGYTNIDTANFKAAIPLYQQAIAQDPRFALALARLSYVESILAWYGGGGEEVEQLIADARTDAERALKLAPNRAASQIAIGYSDYYGKRDYAAALKAFNAALALRANDSGALAARGYVERRQGRLDSAISSLTQAFTHDPRNSKLAAEIGYTCMMANRYIPAKTWLLRALALDPNDRSAKVYHSSAILFGSGDVAAALAAAAGDSPRMKFKRVSLLTLQREFRKAIALVESIPEGPDNFSVQSDAVSISSKSLLLAGLYRLTGDTAHARSLFAEALPKARAQLARQQGINLAGAWANVARAELGLGHTAAGLDAVAKSQAIVAEAQDHLNVPAVMEVNASLYAEAGRPDLAIPLLTKALTTPGIGSFYSPVMLWLDPEWDPIRHDPRFQALLKKYAKYKPAVTYQDPPTS